MREEGKETNVRKMEHNAQGLHAMERMISASLYVFIYICRIANNVDNQYGTMSPMQPKILF